MSFVLSMLFWLSVMLIAHSYLLYPLILRLLHKFKHNSKATVENHRSECHVYILMSAFNEESVIEKKVRSVFRSDFPSQNLHFLIGSDGSTDQTDRILKKLAAEFENLHFSSYSGRNGKAMILNRLIDELNQHFSRKDSDIIVMTDANVLFRADTIKHLVVPFTEGSIGQVGAVINNPEARADGIARQEKQYISSENQLKIFEGELWGCMMGAFGACYAMRRSLLKTIPPNTLMEDFYLSMHVLDSGFKAVMKAEAVCDEDLPDEVAIEFRRKRRISAGNFQNLCSYKHLLWSRGAAIAFSFFSHKVLRWFGPLFLLIALISSAILAFGNTFYAFVLIIQLICLSSVVLDKLFSRISINLPILRLISYFFQMNAALLAGLIYYLQGVSTNAWSPTKRSDIDVK